MSTNRNGHEAPGEEVFASLAYLSDDAEPDDVPTLVRPAPPGWATTRSTSLEIPAEAPPQRSRSAGPPAAPLTAASAAGTSPPAKRTGPFSLPPLRPRPVRILPPPMPTKPPPSPPVPALHTASRALPPPPRTFPKADVAPAAPETLRPVEGASMPRSSLPRSRAHVLAGATLAAGGVCLALLLLGGRPPPQAEPPPAALAAAPAATPPTETQPAAPVPTSDSAAGRSAGSGVRRRDRASPHVGPAPARATQGRTASGQGDAGRRSGDVHQGGARAPGDHRESERSPLRHGRVSLPRAPGLRAGEDPCHEIRVTSPAWTPPEGLPSWPWAWR